MQYLGYAVFFQYYNVYVVTVVVVTNWVPAIMHGFPSGDNTCYKHRDANARLPTNFIKFITRETMC